MCCDQRIFRYRPKPKKKKRSLWRAVAPVGRLAGARSPDSTPCESKTARLIGVTLFPKMGYTTENGNFLMVEELDHIDSPIENDSHLLFLHQFWS